MGGWKFAIGLVLLFTVVLFMVQNAEPVEVRFLFWTFGMRRAILLFLVLIAGMGLGWLAHALVAHRSRRKRPTGDSGGRAA